MNINYNGNDNETSSISSNDSFPDIPHKVLSRTDSNFLVNSSKFNEQPKSSSRKTPTKGASKIPERNSVNPIRRKSKIEKKEELSKLKIGAMNQIENTIKITDLIKDRGSKLSEFQTENDNLRKEVRDLQLKLEESKSINFELSEKLRISSETRVRRKIETENQRTNEFLDVSLSPQSASNMYLQDIIGSRDRLLNQNKHLQAELEKSENRVSSLSERIRYLESISDRQFLMDDQIDDSNIDSRSKTDLLKLIREHFDDKMIWKEYAIKLTQEIVYSAPDLLHINNKAMTDQETAEFCCKSEAKWANFAITLLEKINKANPTLLQDMTESENNVTSSNYFNSRYSKI